MHKILDHSSTFPFGMDYDHVTERCKSYSRGSFPMKLFRLLPPAAGLSLALAGGAHASVLTSYTTKLPADHYTAPTSFTPGKVTLVATGSVKNKYASPFSDTTSPFVAVEGGGSATYNISGRSISFVFGSPDSYNTITFLNGGKFVDNFSPVVNGPLSRFSNYFVDITAKGNFTSVVFSSTTAALELSNVAISSVPLPATAPLFGAALLALGGFGYSLNRWVAPKGKKEAAAA